MVTVEVRYYAVLREQAGRESERFATDVSTVRDLFADRARHYGFRLPGAVVRFAVNGRFVGPEHVLNEGDEVVFVPPVAGG